MSRNWISCCVCSSFIQKSPTEEDGEHCSIRLGHSRSELNLAELNVALGEQTSSNAAAEATPAETKLGGEEKTGASLGFSDLDKPVIIDDSKESADHTNTICSFSEKKLFVEGQQEDEQAPIPSELIFRRINSKRIIRSYQLGKKLSCKWTTGAGPRIGCVRDYPSELQFRALEEVNLSPRSSSESRFDTPQYTDSGSANW